MHAPLPPFRRSLVLRHRPLLLGLLLLLGLTSAFAAPDKPALVTARLLCLSLMNSEPVDLYVIVNKKPVLLRVPEDYFGTPVDYHGPATLGVYSKATPPVAAADGQPPTGPQPLATIDLPPAGGEFVLLFGGTGQAPRLALLDFSTQEAPLGGYVVWNLTQRPLAITLNQATALVPSSRHALLLPANTPDSYMALRVFDETDGRQRQLFAARHFHQEKARQLVFITDTATPNRVKLKIITQRTFTPLPADPVPPLASTATPHSAGSRK